VYSTGGKIMHIRTTLDPISLHEAPDPEHHPCLYDGDGKMDRKSTLKTKKTNKSTWKGNGI